MQTTLPRKIRSFVRREGRMTSSQRTAFDTLFERYAVPEKELIDWQALFGRIAPNVIEIGFGMGHSLLTMAMQHPEQNYLGIEVHRPGVGAILAGIEKAGITNIRVCCTDAVDLLEKQIAEQSVDTVQLFFPDPWPKKRHQKRRIVQPEFMTQVIRVLKPGGRFIMATDCENYAQQALSLLNMLPYLKNEADNGQFITRPDSRPITKFEQRGQTLGHGIWDLSFIKIGDTK